LAPTKALADSIVLEWADQSENIDPDTMPLTQILTTQIDRIQERKNVTEKLMRYLDSDLVCYWTKEPPELLKQEKEIWGRWVKWFDEHFEVPLYTTKKIESIKQDPEAHKRVWNYIEALDDSYFTILHIVTALTGSIILGLAFVEGQACPDELYKAAYLEELFKERIYDSETHGLSPEEENEREAFKRDIAAAKAYLKNSDQFLSANI
jgi:chaperone required for assembly of F1-ATPase